MRFLVDAQFDALLPDIERALLAGEKLIEVAPRDRTPFQLILRIRSACELPSMALDSGILPE